MVAINPNPWQGPHGEVRYGGAWPRETFAVQLIETSFSTPLRAVPVDFGKVRLIWSQPEGSQWDEAVITRNSYGCPVSPLDGSEVVAWATGTGLSTHDDSGLNPGSVYYYSMFVKANEGPMAGAWVRTARCDVVVTKDWDWYERFRDAMPWWYHVEDQRLGMDRPLERFLRLFSFEVDGLHSEINTLFDLHDIRSAHARIFPTLAASLGVEYMHSLGDVRMRDLLYRIMDLRKSKGSRGGLEGWVKALTGYETEVAIGYNLMLTNDSSDFRGVPDPALWDDEVTYHPGAVVVDSAGRLWMAIPNDGPNLDEEPADDSTFWTSIGVGSWVAEGLGNERPYRLTGSGGGLPGPRTDLGYMVLENTEGDTSFSTRLSGPGSLESIPVMDGGIFRDSFVNDDPLTFGVDWENPLYGGTSGGRGFRSGPVDMVQPVRDLGVSNGFVRGIIGLTLWDGDGLCWRYADADEYVRLVWDTGQWHLIERVGGVDTELEVDGSLGFDGPNAAGVDVLVHFIDGELGVSFDGVLYASTTSTVGDENTRAGIVGVGYGYVGYGNGAWSMFEGGEIGGTVSPAYTFSYYIRPADGVAALDVVTFILWKDRTGTGGALGQEDTFTTDLDTWDNRVAITSSPPKGAFYACPTIRVTDSYSDPLVGDAGSKVFIDDIVFNEGTEPLDWQSPRRAEVYCCPDRTNWCANSSFAVNDDGWTPSGATSSRDTSGVYDDGTGVLEVVADGGEDATVTYADDLTSLVHYVPVLPDTDYTFSFEIIDTDTAEDPVQYRVEVDWYKSGDFIRTDSSEESEVPQGVWNRVGYTVRSPSELTAMDLGTDEGDDGSVEDLLSGTPTHAKVRLVFVDPPAAREFRVNNVLFEKAGFMVDFFDGDSESHYGEFNWLGEAGASWSMFHHQLSIRAYILEQDIEGWVPNDLDWAVFYRCRTYPDPPLLVDSFALTTEDGTDIHTEDLDVLHTDPTPVPPEEL